MMTREEARIEAIRQAYEKQGHLAIVLQMADGSFGWYVHSELKYLRTYIPDGAKPVEWTHRPIGDKEPEWHLYEDTTFSDPDPLLRKLYTTLIEIEDEMEGE